MSKYTNYIEGIFSTRWISKFINKWFFIGEQQKVEGFLYASFFLIKKKLKIAPVFFFFEALEKLKPIVGFKIISEETKKVN